MRNLIMVVTVLALAALVTLSFAQVSLDPSALSGAGEDQVSGPHSPTDLYAHLKKIGLEIFIGEGEDRVQISPGQAAMYKMAVTSEWGIDWADPNARYTLTVGAKGYRIEPVIPASAGGGSVALTLKDLGDVDEVRIIGLPTDEASASLLGRVGISTLTPKETSNLEVAGKNIPGFKVGNARLPVAIADGKFAFASVTYYSVPYREYERMKEALGQSVAKMDELVVLAFQLEREWAEYRERMISEGLKSREDLTPQKRAEGEALLAEFERRLAANPLTRGSVRQGNRGDYNLQGDYGTIIDASVKINNSIHQTGPNSLIIYESGPQIPGISMKEYGIRRVSHSFRQIRPLGVAPAGVWRQKR